jgi:hypothetical protein
MVVVLVGGLVEDAVLAEVGAQDEPRLDEHVEGAVDGRGGDRRCALADAVGDVLGAEVAVGLARDDVPDQAALAGQAPAAAAQGGLAGLRRVAVVGRVLVGAGHVVHLRRSLPDRAGVGRGHVRMREEWRTSHPDPSSRAAASRRSSAPAGWA